MTHDTSDRPSYYLFAAVSDRRAAYTPAQANMKDICNTCHSAPHTERFYAEAESVVTATNAKIKSGLAIMDDLRKEGILTKAPFDEPIEFNAFELWHYYGRTTKPGAFIGRTTYDR